MTWTPNALEFDQEAALQVQACGVLWIVTPRRGGQTLHLGTENSGGFALDTAGARLLGVSLIEMADRLDRLGKEKEL